MKAFSTWLFKVTHRAEIKLLNRLAYNQEVRQHNLIKSILIKLSLEDKNVGKD